MKIKLLFLAICSSMVYAPGFDAEDDNGYDDGDSSEINDEDFAAQLRKEYLEKFRDEDDDKDISEPIPPRSPASIDTSVGYNSLSSTASSDVWIAQTPSDSGLSIDDTTQKSVAFNFADSVKENANANMLEHFENNFIDFDNDADAVQAVEKYLNDGGNPNAINAQEKSLISLLLENISSDKKSNATIKQVLTLLLDKGATPTSAEIEQALQQYRNFAELNPSLKVDPATFKTKSWGLANSFVSRFLSTDAQKEQTQQDKQNALALVDVVFKLDDAAAKGVVTPEQREKISNLEAQYKTTFQRVSSWWNRVSKGVFSKK